MKTDASKKKKKLQLTTETLRRLSNNETRAVRGGIPTSGLDDGTTVETFPANSLTSGFRPCNNNSDGGPDPSQRGLCA